MNTDSRLNTDAIPALSPATGSVELLQRLRAYRGQLAPHQKDRRGAILMLEAIDEIDRLQRLNDIHCTDWAEAHTHAQTVAKRVGVPKTQVEGDSYGVPGIEELVDMIADRIPPNSVISHNSQAKD